MRAVVVYQSFWGNTARIAEAIAEGIGDGAVALSTLEADEDAVRGADLVIVGAPMHGFSLPPRNAAANLGAHDRKAPRPADTSHTPLREWIEALPDGSVPVAAFDTRFKRSPGNAAKKIARLLGAKGYRVLGHEPFMVSGTYGPLADGELDRARAWGVTLAAGVSS